MLRLRRPGLLFGALAVVLVFAIPLALAAFVSGPHATAAAQGLFTPTLIGLALTLFSIAPRMRRERLRSRIGIVARTATAFAVAGFVWPLSFAIAVLLQGDAQAALRSLGPALVGLLVGAAGGALGGAAAAYACFTPQRRD